MKTQPETDFVPTFLSDLDSGDAAAAVITVTAVENVQHVIDWIHCSYDGTAGDASLAIAYGGANKWKLNITKAGVYLFEFPGGFYNGKTVDEELVITLTAVTASQGQLNARVR